MREIDITKTIAVSILWRRAGLLSIWAGFWALHFGVKPKCWKWGRVRLLGPIPVTYYGLGPVVLICRS